MFQALPPLPSLLYGEISPLENSGMVPPASPVVVVWNKPSSTLRILKSPSHLPCGCGVEQTV